MLHRARYNALLLCSAAAIGLAAISGEASAAEKRAFEIEAQPLATALMAFGNQSGVAVVAPGGLTLSKTTSSVSATVEPETALQMMLAGTGLTYRREGDLFAVVQEGEGGSPQATSGAGGAATVEALIVTAQKKEEAIQDVPIAISAFTQKSLDEQKIEGGFDLLKAIPNVSFSKSNFSGYNFSIRGIGTKAVSATTDPGVAVAFNNSTLIVNRLFEQEYFDVERVEVLRGPQGTLYGRNATGGVINVLSARPRLGEFEGDIKLEGGNYNARRARGMVNIPVGDTLAIRLAGALTKRDGYGTNLAASDPLVLNDVREDVDGRDLWSGRITVGWEPIEQVRINAMWERFEEDDNRVRTSKQLCKHDPGFNDFENFDWETSGLGIGGRAAMSQGCLPVSLYDDAAYGTPNGASLPYVGGFIFTVSVGIGFIANRTDFYGLGVNPYLDQPYMLGTPLPAPCEGFVAIARAHYPIDICQPDPYGNQTQSRDLRTIHSAIEPTYRAKSDVFEFSIDVDITDSLTFTSQTLYTTDEYYASQDYNRFATFPIFNDSSIACTPITRQIDLFPPFGIFINVDTSDCTPDRPVYAPTNDRPDGHYNITPGGVYTDPQLGPSSSLLAQDLSEVESSQFNQEFRLASNFDAPVNFSLGANFTQFETWNDYYVFLNAASLLSNFWPFNTHVGCYVESYPGATSLSGAPTGDSSPCLYVDPNPLESINGEGHNYFRSANPYELSSTALFGELYWQATDTVKVTLGGRMSWDKKVFTPIPSQLLLSDYRRSGRVTEGGGPEQCTSGDGCPLLGTGVDGRGSPPNPDIVQEWREPTGRIIVDWKPDLSFTDETMVYGSIAHGYKGGGANPPNIAPPAGIFNARNSGGLNPPTFEPEFINAFEIGSKNTLLNGALVLNGSAFYYDYEGYQVSKIVDRSAYNENFDATVWGVELEWIYSPIRNLRFNGTFGHLNTEIADGEQSLDLMDRTQGGGRPWTVVDRDGNETVFDEWVLLKPFLTNSSNCVAPKPYVELFLENNRSGDLVFLCPGGNVVGATTASLPILGVSYVPSSGPNGGAGFLADVGGNDLPNAPHWTASLGGQYRMALPGGWDATLRGDFYWQSQSYARIYNTQYDKLRAWTNTNISLWVENPDWGVTAEVYVKNVFDETPITDAFLNSDDSGLTTNVFTLDPRLVGVSVRKSF